MATQVEHVKWVPGTTFLVDGFAFKSPRATAYFLTHAHSDHTIGLTKGFRDGPLYCSEVTARLVHSRPGVHASVLRPLPLRQRCVVQGVGVTLLPANHCPGAVMILFEVPRQTGSPLAAEACSTSVPDDVEVILHTGDMRWQNFLAEESCLRQVAGRIDLLFLDTTYCLPRFRFPPQEECIAAMAQCMRSALQEDASTLFVVAAYHIGKERAFFGAAAQVPGCKVWVTPAKRRVLELLDLPPEHMALLADEPHAPLVPPPSASPPFPLEEAQQGQPQTRGCSRAREAGTSARAAAKAAAGAGTAAPEGAAAGSGCAAAGALQPAHPMLHVVNWGLRPESLERTMAEAGGRYRRVVGFKPTGWTFRKKGGLSVWRPPGGHVSLVGVPYSEHSSFSDLCDCVSRLRPRRIVPTVNAATPEAARAIVDRFAAYMDNRGNRGRIDFYLDTGGGRSRADSRQHNPTPTASLEPLPSPKGRAQQQHEDEKGEGEEDDEEEGLAALLYDRWHRSQTPREPAAEGQAEGGAAAASAAAAAAAAGTAGMAAEGRRPASTPPAATGQGLDLARLPLPPSRATGPPAGGGSSSSSSSQPCDGPPCACTYEAGDPLTDAGAAQPRGGPGRHRPERCAEPHARSLGALAGLAPCTGRGTLASTGPGGDGALRADQGRGQDLGLGGLGMGLAMDLDAVDVEEQQRLWEEAQRAAARRQLLQKQRAQRLLAASNTAGAEGAARASSTSITASGGPSQAQAQGTSPSVGVQQGLSGGNAGRGAQPGGRSVKRRRRSNGGGAAVQAGGTGTAVGAPTPKGQASIKSFFGTVERGLAGW